jgi:hypothetical protein
VDAFEYLLQLTPNDDHGAADGRVRDAHRAMRELDDDRRSEMQPWATAHVMTADVAVRPRLVNALAKALGAMDPEEPGNVLYAASHGSDPDGRELRSFTRVLLNIDGGRADAVLAEYAGALAVADSRRSAIDDF